MGPHYPGRGISGGYATRLGCDSVDSESPAPFGAGRLRTAWRGVGRLRRVASFNIGVEPRQGRIRFGVQVLARA